MEAGSIRSTWLPEDAVEPEWFALLKKNPGTTVLDLQSFYSQGTTNQNKQLSSSTSPQKPSGMADPALLDYIVMVLRDKQFSALTELNLNNCNLKLTAFAQALAKNTQLKHLSMLNNNFSLEEMHQLLSVLLQSNFSLTKLQLIDESVLQTEHSRIEKVSAAILGSAERDRLQKQRQVLAMQTVLNRFNEELSDALDGRSARLNLQFKMLYWPSRGSTGVEYVRPLATPALGELLNRLTSTLLSLTIEDFPNALPPELFRLTNLQELVIRRVKLQEGPVFLVRLQQLQTLCFEGCSMMHFDARLLAGMTNLISLNLAGNELRMIPQQIELVQSLERLSLENNLILKIPFVMERLTNLRVLRLHGNMIKTIPLNLAHLPNLVDFTAANQREAQVQGVDQGIISAEKYCIDNRQPSLAVYAWLKRTAEGSMIINRCKLLLVGDANVGKTSTVKSLALFAKGRPVAAIRKGNTNLKKNLSVPLNKFRDAVNSALKRPSAGADEPLTSPPSSSSFSGNVLSSTGTSQSQVSQQSSSTAEKTSTSKGWSSLRSNKSSHTLQTFENVATDGIEIQTVTITTDEVANSSFAEQGITLSCWDFAGQEVYQTTHQFFLGKRSIYLIGFRLDRPMEEALTVVDYWLQTIRLRAPNAPVALLGTHLDDFAGGSENLPTMKKSLMERYKRIFNIADVFFISNATHEGVPDLVRGLVKIIADKKYRSKLGIEEQRPVTYMVLAEALRATANEMQHPVMHWADWCKFVQSHTMIHDEQEVIAATAFLSDVGALLWFDEDGLRDTVVLDCQFLTRVFASIVTVRSTMIRNGVFKHADLPLMWKQFPSALHPFMLSILRKFELIYSPPPEWCAPAELVNILFGQGHASSPEPERSPPPSRAASDKPPIILGGFSFVPSMLVESPPPADVLAKFWDEGAFTSDLSRCYHFSFLPQGFFSRLMVRLLNASWEPKLLWRDALIAVKPQACATLYLTHDPEAREICFCLRGPRSAAQIVPIIDSFHNLMAEWLRDGNATVSIMVHLSDGSSHKMDMKTLEKYVAKGGIFVTINNEKLRLESVVPELAMASIFEEAEIIPSELEIGDEIGRGAFASVRRGVYKGQPVAVKQLLIKDDHDITEEFEEFRREVWLMSRLQHENIVRLLGVALRPQPSMVMELMNGGHLFSYLHRSGKKLEWDEKMSLAMDVARGMQFIHSTKPPIVHRDLKSPNVLLTHREGHPFPLAKIADFGLSRGLEWSSHHNDKVVDNPTWLAPEVIKKETYNEKVDVYAFGVILFEITTQQKFFGEISFFHEIEEKVCQGIRPQIPADIPAYIQEIIEACWQNDCRKRPDFDMIVTALSTQKSLKELAPVAAQKPLVRNASSRQKLRLSGHMTAPPLADATAGGEEATGAPVTPTSETRQQITFQRRRSGRDSLQIPASMAMEAINAGAEGSRSRSNSSAAPAPPESSEPQLPPSIASVETRVSPAPLAAAAQSPGRMRKFSISTARSTDAATAASPVLISEVSAATSTNQLSNQEQIPAVRKRTKAGAPLPQHLAERNRRAVFIPDPSTALASARATRISRAESLLLNTFAGFTMDRSAKSEQSAVPSAASSSSPWTSDQPGAGGDSAPQAATPADVSSTPAASSSTVAAAASSSSSSTDNSISNRKPSTSNRKGSFHSDDDISGRRNSM